MHFSWSNLMISLAVAFEAMVSDCGMTSLMMEEIVAIGVAILFRLKIIKIDLKKRRKDDDFIQSNDYRNENT